MIGFPGGFGAPPPPGGSAPPASGSFLETLTGLRGFQPGFPGTGVHEAGPVGPPPPPGGHAAGPPPPPGVAVGAEPPVRVRPDLGRLRPDLTDFGPPVAFPPDRIPPGFRPPRAPVTHTATQLARSAIVTLTNASNDVVEEAINAIKGRGLTAAGLLDYLARRVRVGEVLNQLAETWSKDTVGDFAAALQMQPDRLAAMDAVVAIAILNEGDLHEELLAENLPTTTEADLLDNRVIVEQWPPGGTAMQPPYLMLVAVEYRDVAGAQQVVDEIVSQLVDHDGFKLPRAAAERLRG
jgi:hypothetical protein